MKNYAKVFANERNVLQNATETKKTLWFKLTDAFYVVPKQFNEVTLVDANPQDPQVTGC